MTLPEAIAILKPEWSQKELHWKFHIKPTVTWDGVATLVKNGNKYRVVTPLHIYEGAIMLDELRALVTFMEANPKPENVKV